MKITTYGAILAACVVLFMGGRALAADSTPSPAEANRAPAADNGGVQSHEELKAWLKSIKPAAGRPVAPVAIETEYWKSSVRRDNRLSGP